MLAVAFVLLCTDLDTEVEDYLDTVVVTATRSPAVAFDTPYAADVVPRETMRKRAYKTVPQVLRDVPGVLVQETSPGQGSPYIRGFTGFLNLLLIDGIRLNNSVFRPGPNQYWNTVDSLSIGRLEIVKGPSSVLYGSDAVGGTVNAITIAPYGTGGKAYYRVASAENSHQGRLEGSVAVGESVAAVGGVTAKQFGDLVSADPTGRQPETGYDEWDGDFKLEVYLDDDTRAVFAAQAVELNNVPRTHRTVFAVPFRGTTVGSDLERDLDQRRELYYAQLHKENMEGFARALHASLSWHVQREVRDRLRTGDRRDKQGFSVGTIGFWVTAESETGMGTLSYGVELYRDNVSSFSTRNPIQGPVADNATYDLFGVFLQDVIALGERVELTAGARVTYAAADAGAVSDPTDGSPISIKDDWTALTGSVRVVFHLVPKKWNVFAGISQGFRAPNLSDLSRFDEARTDEFEIPAPGLDPERYLAFELGAKGRGEGTVVQVSTFYTLIRDQIIRFPTGMLSGDGDTLITKANVGDGYVFGIEVAGSVDVGPVSIFGNLTWMEGKVDTFPTAAQVLAREYMDRLMPLTAQVGVRWEKDRFWAELLVVAAAKADRLSTRDVSDTSRIPPGGTPGYAVVHVRGGARLWDRVDLAVGVENVLDKSYRVHGSGHNMPGLNFLFSVSVSF